MSWSERGTKRWMESPAAPVGSGAAEARYPASRWRGKSGRRRSGWIAAAKLCQHNVPLITSVQLHADLHRGDESGGDGNLPINVHRPQSGDQGRTQGRHPSRRTGQPRISHGTLSQPELPPIPAYSSLLGTDVGHFARPSWEHDESGRDGYLMQIAYEPHGEGVADVAGGCRSRQTLWKL